MKKIFLMFLLFCSSVFAQTNYNSIATAYVTTTISQNVVFNSTMQQGGTFTFSVLAHNGGGRAGESDTANVKIQFYTSAGTLITSVNSNYSANLPNPNAVCGNPCIDPAVPWTTLTTSATLTAEQAATVAYATISMYGVDGSWWAGDYGPWYRAPTFTLNGGGNMAYNPEFGPYNGIQAQGWTTNPALGACQGAWGGSNPCIANSDGTPGVSTVGLVANQNGGGPDPNGGTTSGTAGGYNSTMSTTNPAGGNTEPAGPTVTGGTITQTNAPTTQVITSGGGYVNPITNAEQTRMNNWANGVGGISAHHNTLYIDQVGGNYNAVTVTQTGWKNRIDLTLNGNGSNTIFHTQTGSNYLTANINGANNQLTTNQTQSVGTNYAETVILGNSNIINHTQSNNNNRILFSEINGNNNTVTTTQSGGGQHELKIKLTGNGHTVLVDQNGAAGANKAHIELTNSGGAASVDLQQTGGKTFSIIQGCTNPAGCTTVVRQ